MPQKRTQKRRTRKHKTSNLLQSVTTSIATYYATIQGTQMNIKANDILEYQDRPSRISTVAIQVATNSIDVVVSFKLHSSDGEGAIQTPYVLLGQTVRTFKLRMPRNIDFLLPKAGNNILFTIFILDKDEQSKPGTVLLTFTIVYKGVNPPKALIFGNVEKIKKGKDEAEEVDLASCSNSFERLTL